MLPRLPLVRPSRHISKRAAAAANAYVREVVRLAAYFRAALIARDREAGAIFADDHSAANEQNQAMIKYATEAAGLLQRLPTLAVRAQRATAGTSLAASATLAQVRAFAARIRANGLPAVLRRKAVAFGLSRSEQSGLATWLGSLDPGSLPHHRIGLFASPVKAAGAALLSCALRDLGVRVGGTC